MTGSNGARDDFEPAIAGVALRKYDFAFTKFQDRVLRINPAPYLCRQPLHATSPISNWYLRRPRLRFSSAFPGRYSIRVPPSVFVCRDGLCKSLTFTSLAFTGNLHFVFTTIVG